MSLLKDIGRVLLMVLIGIWLAAMTFQLIHVLWSWA
jgi:hypothetical protein